MATYVTARAVLLPMCGCVPDKLLATLVLQGSRMNNVTSCKLSVDFAYLKSVLLCASSRVHNVSCLLAPASS